MLRAPLLRWIIFALTLSASAPAIAAAISAAPGTAFADEPLRAFVTADLDAKFRSYDLQFIDRDALVADAEDGLARLTLYEGTRQERTYDLAFEERLLDVVFVDAETGERFPVAYAPRFFHGRVANVEGSSAFLVATEAGVSGFVRTADSFIQYEGLGGFQQVAPPGLTVVYGADAVVATAAKHPEPIPLPTALPTAGVAAEDEGPTTQHTSRETYVGLDSEFYSSTAWSSWQSKAGGVGGYLDYNFEQSAGWSMVGGTLFYEVCTTQTCDGQHGMEGANCSATLSNFASHSGIPGHWLQGWQFRSLLTYRSLPDCSGIAYRPGRYSIVMTRNSGSYDGASSNFEAGQVMSQEVGHNLNAQHSHGWITDHDHGSNHVHTSNHCHLPDPAILGICVTNHAHNSDHWHADIYRHVDIMKSSYCYNNNDICGGSDPSTFHGGKGEWFGEFGTNAVSVMDSCNHNLCYW